MKEKVGSNTDHLPSLGSEYRLSQRVFWLLCPGRKSISKILGRRDSKKNREAITPDHQLYAGRTKIKLNRGIVQQSVSSNCNWLHCHRHWSNTHPGSLSISSWIQLSNQRAPYSPTCIRRPIFGMPQTPQTTLISHCADPIVARRSRCTHPLQWRTKEICIHWVHLLLLPSQTTNNSHWSSRQQPKRGKSKDKCFEEQNSQGRYNRIEYAPKVLHISPLYKTRSSRLTMSKPTRLQD